MGSARNLIERTVSGIGFSVLCFLIWGGLTGLRARHLVVSFSWMEVVWLAYNATIAVLFLVRSRPMAVSLNPVHWLVALLASFSGLFFEKESAGIAGAGAVADGLILLGLAGSGTAALALRRSYDFLPALRGVTTDWLFRLIRHPMYVSSILIRLGYLGMHASMYNAAVFAVMVWLYVKRVDYEEDIMQQDKRYVEYMRQVRYRFLPGIY
jgi:protein-S-isoprenylcysteine O-methyltransferase Ste14